MKIRIAITLLLVAGLGRTMVHGAEPDRAAPSPPPPQDRSLLPAPREAVMMVQVISGRLDVATTTSLLKMLPQPRRPLARLSGTWQTWPIRTPPLQPLKALAVVFS